jgi:hypothetical protein
MLLFTMCKWWAHRVTAHVREQWFPLFCSSAVWVDPVDTDWTLGEPESHQEMLSPIGNLGASRCLSRGSVTLTLLGRLKHGLWAFGIGL